MLLVEKRRTKYHESANIQKSVMGLPFGISYDKYTCKRKFENSESKDLRDMNSRLTKLAQKLGKETDENKRQEMIQEYKNVASTYNALVDNTTVTGFQRVAEEPVLVNGAEMLASAEI